jgi:hypothetical protein
VAPTPMKILDWLQRNFDVEKPRKSYVEPCAPRAKRRKQQSDPVASGLGSRRNNPAAIVAAGFMLSKGRPCRLQRLLPMMTL